MRKDIKIIRNKIIIDDAFAEKNFYEWDDHGDLRFYAQLGAAHSDEEPPKLVLYEYVLSDDLSPHYKTGIAKFYTIIKECEKLAQAHELHHMHNAEAGWNKTAWSENLGELVLLSYLDELSAHMAGYLDKEDLNQQNIYNAMIKADQNIIVMKYFKESFSKQALAFVREFSDKKPEMFSLDIDGDKIKKVMNHYFTIKNKNVLSELSKSQQLALGRMIATARKQILEIVSQQKIMHINKQKAKESNE
jgi:hypothetical protein